jgi:hypothetical protein
MDAEKSYRRRAPRELADQELAAETRDELLYRFVCILIDIDKRVKRKAMEKPVIPPPEEFWMDPE